jgi:hypothetical protein
VRFRSRLALPALCLLALLAAGVCWRVWRQRQAPPPLEVSLWYWHQPFSITVDEASRLHALGVRQIFVRAATFRYGDAAGPAVLSLPQIWKTRADRLAVHLVFPVDYSLVRRFEQIPEDRLRAAFTAGIRRERQRAERAGIRVAGVQIDLDCPTRLLPHYARLLAGLRADLGTSGVLSVTLLTSWYASRDLLAVLDAVDFSVPQFYEAQTPRTRDQFTPISDLPRLSRGLRAAGRFGKPFYAGLPSYGHALVYDGQGRLRGLFHDASAAELITRPDEFHLLGVHPIDAKGKPAATPDAANGEEIVEFGPAHAGTDFRLLYDLPTPDLLARHLAMVRTERPDNCRGVILYRYPSAGESETLPLPTVEAILRGAKPVPQLRIRLRTRRSAPWEMVEAERPEAVSQRTNLYVTVTNIGDGPTRIAQDAVDVALRFDHPGIEDASRGTFDTVEAFAGEPENRSSLPRADGIRLRAASLAPGESRTAGPFFLSPDGPSRVRGTWSAALPGGFDTAAGEIPETPVTRSEAK